jgi:hypothetical protein
VGAAFVIANEFPGAMRPEVLNAVSDSFVQGFQTACLVGVVMAFVGAIFALKFLPARPGAGDS